MGWLILLIIVIGVAAAPFVAEWRRKPMDGSARSEAPGQFYELSNGVTHIHQQGSNARGPVLVLVHGLTTPRYVWDALIPGLDKMGFQIVSYDLFGRGYSDRPKDAQDRTFFLKQLDEVLQAADVPETFSLMGFSMGGAIATAYASAHPERVDRLILIASAGLDHVQNKTALFLRDTPILGDWLMTVVGSVICRSGLLGSGPETEMTRRQAREIEYRGFLPAVLSSQRHLLREDQTKDHAALEDARVPTLAIWGEEDDVIPITSVGRLAQANRAAHQEQIAGADHRVAYTHPDEVNAVIGEFMIER